MKFLLLEQLVKKYAADLSRSDALSGGRGDGGSYAWISKLENLRNELIILHDLRPSEIKTMVPNLDVKINSTFKEVIEAATLELISNVDYEELFELVKEN